MSITNPAKCEVRSVMRFLLSEGVTPSEMLPRITAAYGPDAINRTNVFKWCRQFKEGRTEVHDASKPGRPSLMTDALVKKIEDTVKSDHRLTMDEIAARFPKLSRSLLHDAISDILGFRKLCAHWVPKEQTEEHKIHRLTNARHFLQRLELEGEDFLGSIIVSADATWITRQRKGARWDEKITATLFWDRKGIVFMEFGPEAETSRETEWFCETLKKLRRAIQNKRRGMLSKGVCLLLPGEEAETAAEVKALLDSFGWGVLHQPPYSPDLSPSDFHLFHSLKFHTGRKKFSTEEEVTAEVKMWKKEVAGEAFFEKGFKNLVQRLTTCVERDGEYVEK